MAILDNFPDATSIQKAILQLLVTSVRIFSVSAARTLKAEYLIGTQNTIQSLPNDHWAREARGWVEMVWADLQFAISDYAIGPKARNSDADEYVKKPRTAGEKQLCQLQKMRRSGGFV